MIHAASAAVLGIDPGVRGGFALLQPDGRVAMHGGLKPDMTEVDVVNNINLAISLSITGRCSLVCYMEKVGFIKGDGGKGSFTFGRIYGLLRGVLHCRSVPINDVYPVIWQAKLGCLTGGNKNVSKKRAIELFPKLQITHATADALLIARYGWQALGGRCSAL